MGFSENHNQEIPWARTVIHEDKLATVHILIQEVSSPFGNLQIVLFTAMPPMKPCMTKITKINATVVRPSSRLNPWTKPLIWVVWSSALLWSYCWKPVASLIFCGFLMQNDIYIFSLVGQGNGEVL